MVLKDTQCPEDGCGGMVQWTIESDEHIVEVGYGAIGWRSSQKCPECGYSIGIKTESK